MTDFRARLIAEAETWAGVPFHWQQASKRGCDCHGLIVGIARECGRPEALSREALMAGDYKGRVPVNSLRQGLAHLFDKVTEAKPGDVLLMKFRGEPQHLAMYLGDGRIIHSHQRQRHPAARIDSVRWHDVDSIWSWRDADS